MNAFLLVLALALLAMIGWWLNRRRRRRLTIAFTTTEPSHQAPAGAQRNAIRSHQSPELGVWRPPPRRQLLHRQQEEARERASRDDPTPRPSEIRRRTPTGWPPAQTASTPPLPSDSSRASRTPLTLDQPPVTESVAARPTRLGRKRQGLDSLITEWPQEPKDASSEP